MADLSRLESALRILNLEHPKVMIFRIKLLKTSHIDLVLKLCDTQVLDFDRVSDGPFKTNRHRRQVIGVLDQLQLRSTVESLSFEFDAQWLAV